MGEEMGAGEGKRGVPIGATPILPQHTNLIH